ncbi:Hypothetical protein PBC10988_35200 [Planctomycetales bacterium 10988]|nr:Hypothetical protein PBC10988_35200 [Planctomycetales bacterium 10988]
MSERVRVGSLDSLEDFVRTLQTFQEEAGGGLIGVELETRRFLEWLKNDQFRYWKIQYRKADEKLAEAKAELHRKKITAAGQHRSLVEEQKMVRKWKMRMEVAEEKLAKIKYWVRATEEAFSEFKGQAQQLRGVVDSDVPRAIHVIKRIIHALERYFQLQAPTSQREPESSSTWMMNVASSSSETETEEEEPAIDFTEEDIIEQAMVQSEQPSEPTNEEESEEDDPFEGLSADASEPEKDG